MKRFLYIIIACLLFLNSSIFSQDFSITLDPYIPENFTGLQSYAWAKDGNRVLLIGGRTDGLHKKQPFASFNKENNNTEFIVLDLESEKVWKRSILELPTALTDQLQSSNMEFWQENNLLILVGGYGYSEIKKDHITHPSLTILKVKETIDAIINSKSIKQNIRQVKDERMAITGGHLAKLGDSYMLIGGQRFDGRYNPHGPDHGPGYQQQYSDEIRKFNLSIKNLNAEISNYTNIKDTALFHRRDYNLVPQYNEKGDKIYTIFSGVFRPEIDLPYNSLVDINENGGKLVNDFSQLYCHYHTASLPIYNSSTKTQYAIFFGGIGQFFLDSAGKTQKDDDVPFTKVISVIKRHQGKTTELAMPEQLPGYFGASACFIPSNDILFDSHSNLKWEALKKEKTLVGYIIGGIDSSAPNVFWDAGRYGSIASTVVWKVYLSTEK